MKKPKKILLSEFDYHLPPKLIGQKPTRPRDNARLLILDRRDGAIAQRWQRDAD